ncbi:HD domain-containing phosphohydrolase [Desulfosediminicola ganghwensis]|uniref:HD domain-containing phosphohydrolase n=1 Tax=Desulfosediminicola ganghwensis TaxID=2569540 RepID=UPI0010ACF637|nr:HD domain-containing phosphohydrolase [Desulfosediminicola ganghwensis]
MAEHKVRKTLSIRTTVFGVFLFMSCLIAGLTLGLQHYFSKDLAQTAAESSFHILAEMINERVKALDSQSVNLVGVLSHFYELENFPGPEQELRAIKLFAGAMENAPSIYAVYIGYDTGELFEIINLESSDNVRGVFGAAQHDRWLALRFSSVNGVRKKTTVYLDSAFSVRFEKTENTDYDPRVRPWFKDALATPGIIKTAPYLFSSLKSPGLTYATSIDGGQRVAAVDISLAGLSDFLQKQQLLPDSQAFMFDKHGEIIAQTSYSTDRAKSVHWSPIALDDEEQAFLSSYPVIKASNEMNWPPFDFALSGKPKGYSVDLLNLLADKAGFRVEYVNGYSWEELVALFKDGKLDLLHSLLKNPEREKMGVFTSQYMPMPQAFVVRKDTPIPSSLAELAGKTVAIPKGWATDTYLAENHPEVKRLHVANSIEAMRAVSSKEAYATLDSEPVVRYLANSYFLKNLEIGGRPEELEALGESAGQGLHFLVRPEKELLAGILEKAMASLANSDLEKLDAKWFGTGKDQDEKDEVRKTVPHPVLLELASEFGTAGGLRVIEIKGHEYFCYVAQIESVYGSSEFLGLLVPVQKAMAPYLEKIRFSLIMTLILLLLLTPLVWYCSTIIVRPINALVVESDKVKQRRYMEVAMVESNIKEIRGLSRSMVTMASAIQAYEVSLRELMDSFIRLIAVAIDQKSPYTGGHCARVPELSLMLAKAASESTTGGFAGFSLETDDEWREFRTAAWLHDCGKVITPEHIVDKATKLESIYNRIHEVRMRFEVLLRDAEIGYWRELAQGEDIDEAALREKLAARQQELKNDFRFIAECNLGGEFMAQEKVERVHQIAKQTWVRHFSDRLGLGRLELDRFPTKEPTLPCEEPLLADRPEHIVEHPKQKGIGGSSSDFAMQPLKHLYNLGEIYNLCVSKGTLTAEDRYKINEHIITTINMLETLPFPENMTRIPEYAGTHHETLNGTGYPRKLSADQISIPGRIVAIADVFEALTASDRPYKKAKSLREAIEIMTTMAKNNHLDGNLFRLFLESGIYLTYARTFLDPEQIDEVDIEAYLGTKKF